MEKPVLTFPVSINGGDREVDVTLESNDYKRFMKIMQSIKEDIENGCADEMESFDEIADVYANIREQVVNALAEDLQMEPGAYEDEFEEEDVDPDDIDSIEEYVVDELDFYIGWPNL